jgi:hypothetical protein
MASTTTTEAPVLKIVAATFGSEEAAKAAKAQLVADEDAVGNIAIVTAHEDGKVRFKETGDMGPGKGALVGGGVGLVISSQAQGRFSPAPASARLRRSCATRGSTTASSRASARISRQGRQRS